MEKDLILSLLEEIYGQLSTGSIRESKSLEEGLHLLAKAFSFQSLAEVQSEKLSIQHADFFFSERLTQAEKSRIEKLVMKAVDNKSTDPERKVFIREVPILTSQIKASVPEWAIGAKPEKTIGPIIRVDGREIFLDVYKVEKLIALRRQGTNEPLILFNAILSTSKTKALNAPAVEVSDKYALAAGSVWIKADLFAANAPADRYFGLKVKSGTVTLTAKPVLQGQHLVLASTNQVTVQLKLEAQVAKPAKSKKRYGRDASASVVQCPEELDFQFTGMGKGQIQHSSAAHWKVYGKEGDFNYIPRNCTFNTQLNRFCIPYSYNESDFSPRETLSEWTELKGKATVRSSWWAIPAGMIDINAPLRASGIGAMLQEWDSGISVQWTGLKGQRFGLEKSMFLVESGRIAITSLAGESTGGYQDMDHWKDTMNPHGTSIHLSFSGRPLYVYNSLAEGAEIMVTQCNAQVNIDRPKQVNGHAVSVKTKQSTLLLGGNEEQNLLYLLDDNILWDNKLPADKIPKFENIALALENALFTVSPVNGCMVFGKCNPDWTRIVDSQTFLVFGMTAYLPTLPDPYLANFGVLGRGVGRGETGLDRIQNWLFCKIEQKPGEEDQDKVIVSFHFGPAVTSDTASAVTPAMVDSLHADPVIGRLKNYSYSTPGVAGRKIPDYEGVYDQSINTLGSDFFTLLDVSSNASQLGVSMGSHPIKRDTRGSRIGLAKYISESEATIESENSELLTVEGMEVKVPGRFARIFLLPQIAWEPVFNLTPNPEFPQPMDPPYGYNYYPNDGGPTRLLNSSSERVALAPIPLSEFLVKKYQDLAIDVLAQFTLPFGLKAVASLHQGAPYSQVKPKLGKVSPSFPADLKGGIQIRAIGGDAGKKLPGESHMNDLPMFAGFTFQLNNVVGALGNPTGGSTLGDSVTTIFNGEFSTINGDPKGVPVRTIDFTGYGASIFSNWLSPSAAIASTSQARFDVMLGRTGHEVIQVKSLVYPWGIRVVRTITLFRTSSGFVYRVDSGWQPETDGRFDFRYKFVRNGQTVEETPYQIHPGTLRGLYHIRNIQEDGSLADFERTDYVKPQEKYINVLGEEVTWNGPGNKNVDIICRPVWFDADVELENLVQGHTANRTPAKKVLGYVQLAPTGVPLTASRFRELLSVQGGLIGGDIDCVMDVNATGQQMRISRFDFSHATNPSSDQPIFVASARGSVILPKTGSWTMVQHSVSTGDVTPLPPHIPVPLIREGLWDKNTIVKPTDVSNKLLRLASPSELLRNPLPATINYGILQTTSTQKALILTPSFRKAIPKLLSKTPLLFADAYRLMSGNGIFPNVGNAVDEYGKSAVLFTGVTAAGVAANAFKENDLRDGGVKVLEVLDVLVAKQGQSIVDQGFRLLSGKANDLLGEALAFDLPPSKTYLVEMESLKIYIDYQTAHTQNNTTDYVDSKLNFDIDSFVTDAAKTWKSRLNNVAMVVDLGSFERLMTIKGNFDAQQGKESGYEGKPDSDFPALGYPTPEITFSEELQPVIEILQLLASLGTGDYADVMNKGLQIAMSNAGEIWEYKFEATKEIPLIQFPPGDAYHAPQTPLKLEAGLELGVYFNAALKVTTDPNQLLPTAGAFIQFRGGLEVMCATVGGATIYAVGEVQLKVACDTKIGPSLAMKFGFGATIAVGLPVIGNVSVTYIVGCELYASVEEISITAFMKFEGRASLVGGLVSVVIYIEASGSVTRKIALNRTECTASVTFGLEISICFIINIDFEETWQETRQIA